MGNIVQVPTEPPATDPSARGLGANVQVDAEGRLYDVNLRDRLSRRGRLDAELVADVEALVVLMTAGKVVREALEAGLEEHGISQQQLKAMMWIRDSGEAGCHLNLIADWLAVTPRTITWLIDSLESQGLVERVPDPVDRRAVRARLTAAGEAKAVAAKRTHHRNVRRVLGVLSPDDKAQLRHLGLKLVRAAGPAATGSRPAGVGRSKSNG
jgi:DNA-binding MarR family transcriptional regulator